MPWFLAGTGALYAALGERAEALTLLASIVPLVGMDAFLHRRTRAATEGLRQRLATRARVVRDGAELEIASEEVVPGDLVRVAASETFPADGLVLAGEELQADESALTGEAFPVRKRPLSAAQAGPRIDTRHWAFAGTRLLTGSASLRVATTGAETLYGEILRSAEQTSRTRTPLQISVAGLTRTLLVAALVLVCRARRRAAAPGLRLARCAALGRDARGGGAARGVSGCLHALPRRGRPPPGPAARARAPRRVCREHRAHQLRVLGQDGDAHGWRAAAHAPAARAGGRGVGSCCARARSLRAARPGIPSTSRSSPQREPQVAAERVATFPFTEDRRRETVVLRERNGDLVAATKGSPEVVLALTALTPIEREAWTLRVRELAAGGHKVIACASRRLDGAWAGGEPDRGLRFEGLLACEDPVREGAADALARCREAGIQVIMVTGDHPDTARAVARELGLGGHSPRVVAGEEIDALLASGDASALAQPRRGGARASLPEAGAGARAASRRRHRRRHRRRRERRARAPGGGHRHRDGRTRHARRPRGGVDRAARRRLQQHRPRDRRRPPAAREPAPRLSLPDAGPRAVRRERGVDSAAWAIRCRSSRSTSCGSSS